ncbi:hypothetical protein [Burkholderia gladioli]|uniref:hypothetical protein n=1 Tax=Burkholderia gladioli TaxID=28095 RepID=UPI0016413770|nr:hypothetical protein [Burkholderia gladioli]
MEIGIARTSPSHLARISHVLRILCFGVHRNTTHYPRLLARKRGLRIAMTLQFLPKTGITMNNFQHEGSAGGGRCGIGAERLPLRGDLGKIAAPFVGSVYSGSDMNEKHGEGGLFGLAQVLGGAPSERQAAGGNPGSLARPFECLGRTWIVHRASAANLGDMPRYDIVDMETGRSQGQVAAPSLAAARILAISSMTMMPTPTASELIRPRPAAGKANGAERRNDPYPARLPALDAAAACERPLADGGMPGAHGTA